MKIDKSYIRTSGSVKIRGQLSVLMCSAFTVLSLVTQSHPTLWVSMDCNPPVCSVHGDSPGGNTGVGGHALLQGIFRNQGLNTGLPHWGWSLGISLSYLPFITKTILFSLYFTTNTTIYSLILLLPSWKVLWSNFKRFWAVNIYDSLFI